MMDERNEFAQKIYDMQQAINNLTEERDKIAAERREKAFSLSRVNSNVLAVAADRTKAYDFIIELTNIVRKYEPDNTLLSNPNAILSQVNFYSEQRMKESAEKVRTELRAGGYTEFSRITNDKQFEHLASVRHEKGQAYKGTADMGITSVNEEITPPY